ncbi:hypothetical protein L0244_01535 [bacterium]|nr:hypothetical protein [bacterium]
MSWETNEKVRQLMEQIAKSEKIDLDPATNPNTWETRTKLEKRVRRENPELNDRPGLKLADGDKERSRKASDCIQSDNMRPLFGAAKCNRDETFFAITGRELEAPKQETTTQGPVGHSKITFAIDKPIRMPILPAKPTKSVDGREITQKMIDAVLAYDINIRPAIVKRDPTEGHGKHDGPQNMPALGRVASTYISGDYVFADVWPVTGYEETLKRMIAPDGPYPYRSIEIDDLDGLGYWLEAISLLGVQKPALNLPYAEFARNSTKQIFRISGESLR